jgi:anaerobic ribonucleoside-triphosphate reductase activating protein
MTSIEISRLHYPVTTLGLWFQGCSIRCPGCTSADTWASGRGTTTVSEVVQAIRPWLSTADGITISGGEPFDQPDALAALLGAVGDVFNGSVLVYSGHPLEAIGIPLSAMEGMLDALITDPFVASEPDTLALRGSDNQRLHLLTARGRREFSRYDGEAGPRHFDIMLDAEGEVWMAGIPGRADFDKLRAVLGDKLQTFSVTQDRSNLRPRAQR